MPKKILVLAGGILAVAAVAFIAPKPAAADGATAEQTQANPAEGLQARVVASFVETGRQHLLAGRAQEAVEAFQGALNVDPEAAEALRGLGQANGTPQDDLAVAEASVSAPAQPVAPAEPAVDDEELVRAQASLKTLCETGRNARENCDYVAAANAYSEALIRATAISPHADVSATVAEASEGLKAAHEGLTAAPVTAVVTSTAPDALTPDDEYAAKFEEAMREVDVMRMPYTGIGATKDLSETLGRSARNRTDHVTQQIGSPSFAAAEDVSGNNLIKARLLKRVSVNLNEQPFERAIEYLRAMADVNILVDPAVVPMTSPVNFTVEGMELRYVLEWILKFQKLDYRIRHGAIFISDAAGLAEKPILVLHDINDLTVRIKDFPRRDLEVAQVATYEQDHNKWGLGDVREEETASERDREGEAWAKFVRNNVAPLTWASEGGVGANSINYRNGKLVVTSPPEIQEQIRELLNSFRKARAVQVAIMARFVEISDDFLDDLGVQWRGRGAGGGAVGEDDGAGYGLVDTASDSIFRLASLGETGVSSQPAFLDATGLTLELGFLKNWEVQIIVSAVRKHKKGNILTAPRVTCFNTQRAFITVSTVQGFVRSYDSDGNPEIGQVNDGIILEVQPFVSADRRYVTLELIPQVNTVAEFQEFSFRRDTTDETVDPDNPDETTTAQDSVQLPNVTTRQVKTTVSVPDGGTLMIGGLARATQTEGYATVPILGDIPLIKYLFTSTRKVDARDNLIVLVTAHIIQQEEE